MNPPNSSTKLFSIIKVMSLTTSVTSASVASLTEILKTGPLHAYPPKLILIL